MAPFDPGVGTSAGVACGCRAASGEKQLVSTWISPSIRPAERTAGLLQQLLHLEERDNHFPAPPSRGA